MFTKYVRAHVVFRNTNGTKDIEEYGFYEISFCRDRVVDRELSGPNCTATRAVGDIVLMFNEYSESDMW